MELELSYASLAEVPSGFDALFTEQDGKAVLTGVKGLSGIQGSVQRLQTALTKERDDHKKTKTSLKAFGDSGLTAEEIVEALSERDELKARVEASGGKPDDAKIQELVDSRVKRITGPIEKKLQAAESRAAEFEKQYNDANASIRQNRISQAIRGELVKSGVKGDAVEDGVALLSMEVDVDDAGNVIARDGGRFTTGIDVSAMVGEAKGKMSYLWPTSVGGGTRNVSGLPDGTPNPYSKGGWNITKQFAMEAENFAQAKRLADSQGVDLDNRKPPEK